MKNTLILLITFMIFKSYTNKEDLIKKFKEKSYKVFSKIDSEINKIVKKKNSAKNENILGLEMGVEFIQKMKKQQTDLFEGKKKDIDKEENKEFLLLLLINKYDDLKNFKFSDLEIYRKEISKYKSDKKIVKTLKVVFKFTHKKEYICQKFIWEKKHGIEKLTLNKKEKSRFIKEALTKCEFEGFLGEELLLADKKKGKKVDHFHNTKKTVVHKKTKNEEKLRSKKKTEAYFNDGKQIKKEKDTELENNDFFNDGFNFKKEHNKVKKKQTSNSDGNGNFSNSHHVVETSNVSYETSSST